MKAQLIPADGLYTLTSLTGYSGGGKKMIASYENLHDQELDAPRIYALGQQHKHLPEILKYAGLEQAPIFLPIVAPYYAGMLVTAGFRMPADLSLAAIRKLYADFFKDQAFITVVQSEEMPKMLGSIPWPGKIPADLHLRQRGTVHRLRPVRQLGQRSQRRGHRKHEYRHGTGPGNGTGTVRRGRCCT